MLQQILTFCPGKDPKFKLLPDGWKYRIDGHNGVSGTAQSNRKIVVIFRPCGIEFWFQPWESSLSIYLYLLSLEPKNFVRHLLIHEWSDLRFSWTKQSWNLSGFPRRFSKKILDHWSSVGAHFDILPWEISQVQIASRWLRISNRWTKRRFRNSSIQQKNNLDYSTMRYWVLVFLPWESSLSIYTSYR